MEEKIIEKILDYIQKSEDFVLTQSPEIIQQALQFYLISSIVTLLFCIIGIFILLITAYYFYFHPNFDKYGSRDTLSAMGCFFGFFMNIPLFIQIFVSAERILKIYHCPKYFLINELLRK